MSILRPTGNVFERDAVTDPRDISQIRDFDFVQLNPFIGLKAGGFAQLRIDRETGARDRIVLDRWTETGQRTLDDRFVTQTPADRTIIDAGLVELNDGGLGAVWIHSNDATGSDTLLYKEIKADGTLGDVKVLASVTTVQGSQYAWQAVTLGSGKILLAGTLAVATNPGDFRVVTMVIEPDGTIVQPFTQLLSTSGALDRLIGLVPLSDGTAQVISATDTVRRDLRVDDNEVEYGVVFEQVITSNIYDRNGLNTGQNEIHRSLLPPEYFVANPAPFSDNRSGLITFDSEFKYTLFNFNTGEPIAGIITFKDPELKILNSTGSVIEERLLPSYEYGSVIPGFEGTDISYGIFDTNRFVNPDGTQGFQPYVEYFTAAGQSFGRQFLADDSPVYRPVLSGQSVIFSNPYSAEPSFLQYNVNGLAVMPGLLPEDAEAGFDVGLVRGAGIRSDSIAALALGGPDAGLFTLGADRRLKIAPGAKLDFETDPVANLVFKVTSTTGSTVDVPVDITLQDRNEKPTDLALSRTAFAFDATRTDEFSVNQVLATLAGTDPDRGDVLTYALTDTANGLFGVVGDKLVVKDAAALGLIPVPTSFNITARTTDVGGLTYDETFRVSLVPGGDPFAVEDTYSYKPTDALNTVRIDILKNDLSPSADIDLATVKIVEGPSLGAARIQNGILLYQPLASGWKPTSLTYSFKDKDGNESQIATVKIKPKGLLPEPYVTDIELTDVPDRGYAEATGDFTLGRSDGVEAMLFVKGGTIRAYSDRIEVTNGEVYSRLGLATTPALKDYLFKGNFTLTAATGVATVVDTGASVDGTDVTPDGDFAPGGLQYAFSAIRLDPRDIFLTGNLLMPGGLGGASLGVGDANAFLINENGFNAAGGKLIVPDLKKFKVPFLPPFVTLETKGVGLTYQPTTDTFKLQGTLIANDDLLSMIAKPSLSAKPLDRGVELYGSAKVVADLGDVNNPANANFLQFRDDAVTGLQVTGKGTLAFGPIALGGGFIIDDIALSYAQSETTTAIGGKLKVGVPFFLGGDVGEPVRVSGEVELIVDPTLEFNKIGIGFSNAQIPIPQVPGLFLEKGALTASNLSRNATVNPAQAPLTFEGNIGFKYDFPAPSINTVASFIIPEWLGLKGKDGKPLTELPALTKFDLTGKLQVDPKTGELAVGGAGNFVFLNEGVFTASVASVAGGPPPTPGLPSSNVDLPLVNFTTGGILASGKFNFANIFTGSGKLKGDLSEAKSQSLSDPSGSANTVFVAASGTGQIKFPNIAKFGALAGQDLLTANFYMHLDADGNFSNDSIGVTAAASIGRGISRATGFQIFGDGDVRFIEAGEFLPQVGSWEVPADLDYITMTAEWETAAPGDVPVIVTYRETKEGPVLATYTEAQFAANNIEIVRHMTGAFGKTVAVFDPRAGVWDVEVVDTTGLGAVREGALAPPKAISFDWTRAERVTADGETGLSVALDIQNAAADALVDIYVDSDAEGYDGVLAAGSLSVAQARAGAVWNAADGDGQTGHLYAVVRDLKHGFTYSPYRSGPVDLTPVPGLNALTGTEGDDTLLGTPGQDSITGRGGNDILVGDGVLLTPEALAIKRLYLAAFQRAPDADGWTHWSGKLAAGETLQSIAEGFVGSSEFQTRFGQMSDQAFVAHLYTNVLGREPDAEGFATLTRGLAEGYGRGPLVADLSRSTEFTVTSDTSEQAGRIFRLYQAALGREPDTTGFLAWAKSSELMEITPDGLVEAFVGSVEFRTRTDGLSHDAFVVQLYRDVLGRDPDPAGRAYWTQGLDGGLSRGDVLFGFAESQEFKLKDSAAAHGFFRQLATPANDVLSGGPGDDSMSGGQGADLIIFRKGDAGRDIVYGHDVYDRILFSGFGYESSDDLSDHLKQVGADAVFEDQGYVVTFIATHVNDIYAMVN